MNWEAPNWKWFGTVLGEHRERLLQDKNISKAKKIFLLGYSNMQSFLPREDLISYSFEPLRPLNSLKY
jgi:hypothetical protein